MCSSDLNYNGNGIDRFDFGNLLLFSPRFGTSYYYINVWEGNATAIKSVLKSNLLNTIEQISANTSTDNVCSALALKAAMADYTNKFNQLNSDLPKIKNFSIFLKDVEFTRSISGMYYANIDGNLPSGSTVLSCALAGWSYIRETDYLQTYIASSNDGTFGIMSNTNDLSNAHVIIRVVYI